MDKSGRLVIPKTLRDQLGFEAGEVEIMLEGAALRIEIPAGRELARERGRAVIPSAGSPVDDVLVESLRDSDRR